MSDWRCAHCGTRELSTHQHEHPDLCCDCLDLSCGMPLEDLNEERKAKGKLPIERPWPRKEQKP